EHLRELIHRKTGLRDRDSSSGKLKSVVESRVSSLNLRSLEDYERFLILSGPAADTEIRDLTLALTTGETHFFRDRGQFDLLERKILPALIEEKQPSRTLRVWSAGCSTGDEAYSIAIALDAMLLANRAAWNIDIRGTDINVSALNKARIGAYTDW